MTQPTFWDFAVDLYARPGVETACLTLQNGVGLDVDMLLFCLWLAGRGEGIAPILDSALAASEEWQAVVAPLRAARRALKMLPEDRGDTARLRIAVKACELDAERFEIEALAGLAGGEHAPVASGRALAEANLKRYFSSLNIAPDLLGRGEVLRILNAAFH